MIKRSYILVLLTCALVFCLAGCGGSAGPNAALPPGMPSTGLLAALGTPPEEPHITSATLSIAGSSFEESGGDIASEPPDVVIDATATDYSWTRYAFGMPLGGTLNNIRVGVENITGEYWVALSDYSSSGKWIWYGSYDDIAVIMPAGNPGDYLSPSHNLYWVVVAPHGSSFTLTHSVVDYDWEPPSAIYFVPPAGEHTVTTEASAFPSLVHLPEIEGIAEEGAPLIFHTRGEGNGADTYVSYYNGTAWADQLIFPLGPRVLMAVAKRTQSMEADELFAAAYDVSADQVYRYRLEVAELLTMAQSAPISNPSAGTITALALECQDSYVWCIAQARRMESSAAIGASYDDYSDIIKTPYSAVLADEEIAGLDVAYEGEMPVVAYSHGTIDTSETVLLDFGVTIARPMWTEAETDYNEPLTIDLGNGPLGELTMLMVSGRDFNLITATLYFDAVLGTLSGGTWFYEDIYEGDLTLDFIHSEIDVDMAADVSWAGNGALSFANVKGTVGYDLSDGFQITGGEVQNETKYYTKLGGGWSEDAYFTGSPGAQLDWQDGAGGPCCAFIKAETLDITELLEGSISTSGELMYWSPGG